MWWSDIILSGYLFNSAFVKYIVLVMETFYIHTPQNLYGVHNNVWGNVLANSKTNWHFNITSFKNIQQNRHTKHKAIFAFIHDLKSYVNTEYRTSFMNRPLPKKTNELNEPVHIVHNILTFYYVQIYNNCVIFKRIKWFQFYTVTPTYIFI